MAQVPKSAEKFEDLFARLETIVGEMEGTDLPLEALLAQYEEGMKLVKACGARLAEAEQKIEILSRGPEKETSSISSTASTLTEEKPEINLF